MEIRLAFLWRFHHWWAVFGCCPTWSTPRRRESFGFSILSEKPCITSILLCFCLNLTVSLSIFLCISLSVPDSHICICWRVCMLHAIEGTQLHRCVAWLAVFSICLKQPPLQDHRPWWRAVEAPFGSFLFDMGFLSLDISHPLLLPLSSWVLLWNKGSCQEGESIIALAQGATFNVSAQMEKRAQHIKSRVM